MSGISYSELWCAKHLTGGSKLTVGFGETVYIGSTYGKSFAILSTN